MNRHQKIANHKIFVLILMSLMCLSIYLFVAAPPPLPELKTNERRIPVASLFAVVAAEQDAARSLYTREIVGKGLKAGFAFDEAWRQPQVEAGPLPALFLRETAAELERRPVRLSLFLGSDYAINDANQFTGSQQAMFKIVRKRVVPVMHFAQELSLYTAMYPDLAVAEACVNCHNNHEQSPKTDWRLNDLMGATTWSYPHEQVSIGELLEVLAALRASIADAYSRYLRKARSFRDPPVIADQWPEDGYYLPRLSLFMDRLEVSISRKSLELILGSLEGKKTEILFHSDL